MTREETQDILMAIQAAYPNFKVPDKTIAVNTWFSVLGDCTYNQVSAALTAYIRSDKSGFPPSIGQIIDKMQMLFDRDDFNEMAAWGTVLKAIGNSGYHAEEEFEKLSPLVQKAVASPGQLREWALQENVDSKSMSVMQSNFMRAYRTEVEREKEIRKLNPELRKLIKQTGRQMIGQAGVKAISISEEREIAENRASPAPAGMRERVKKLMGEEHDRNV